MARGQAEILGIAIIIVLVILGFLFLLRFATPGESAKLKERLNRAQIANNVLSAMLKTSDIICDPFKKPKLEELLIDCAENQIQGGSVVCQGKLSCQYITDVLKNHILKESVGKWKLGYELMAKQAGTILPNFPMKQPPVGVTTASGCPATAEVDSQTYLLPTTTGMLEVTLKICT
ncbi:hypothetical protein HY639_04115 [Candidatus Woesearchaeota archaeon]|nr:hypothetical protein [Candidatus Woesearchaeota archaeon]